MNNLEQNLSLDAAVGSKSDLRVESARESSPGYVTQIATKNYQGLKLLDSTVFNGGTSIMYWM